MIDFVKNLVSKCWYGLRWFASLFVLGALYVVSALFASSMYLAAAFAKSVHAVYSARAKLLPEVAVTEALQVEEAKADRLDKELVE